VRYLSTRGEAPALDFDGVLLAGLARDGGLYVPEVWPALSLDAARTRAARGYASLASHVMAPFVEGSIVAPRFDGLVEKAYASFRGDDPAPLKELGDNVYLLELFHGPTLAFKDYALQVVGYLFDAVLAARGERVTIVAATSGDTGSAAIEACRGRARVDIFVLHPKGRVSDVQRRQMTTVHEPNVHNIAIEGTFDDCQNLVKAMFADEGFRDEFRLSAVNSINWARVMAQSVYYMWAALKLEEKRESPAFAVPTGNFGNVYAGYVARCMGLPVSQFIVASNRNDILTRFFESGCMEVRPVEPSLSPAMDIQVSSNFERLLFELSARHGEVVRQRMSEFRERGRMALSMAQMIAVRSLFSGHRVDDAGTLEAIRAEYCKSGTLLDPHTAIGVAAARAKRRDHEMPVVALATAHPAKFPDAVEKATGRRPALPDFLADLFDREERFTTLPNDLDRVKAFVRGEVRARSQA
jgi:threonine synthase